MDDESAAGGQASAGRQRGSNRLRHRLQRLRGDRRRPQSD